MNNTESILNVIFSFIFFGLGVAYILAIITRRIRKASKFSARSDAQPAQQEPHQVESLAQVTVEDAPRLEVKPIDYRLRNAIAVGAKKAEDDVETALRGLKEHRYFVFRDLIIPSSYDKLSFTEIDHVVVSHYGIFCIETKSHKGNIYGFSRNEKWKQYLNGDKIHTLNSPFRQNNHHVRSLEALLSDIRRAPIHSYIAFPFAHKVVVDSVVEDMKPSGVVRRINQHTTQIYDDADVELIAKTLAHIATYRESLKGRHAEEIRAYVNAKVADTLTVSK